MKQSPLTLAQFNLISLAVQSILDQLPDLNAANRSCIAFACIGSLLSRKYYGLKTNVVAGEFFVRIGDEVVLGFANQSHENWSSSEGFHMWIETETHVLDFMSPLYNDILLESEIVSDARRSALMVPFTNDVRCPDRFENGSPVLALPNPALTQSLLDGFLEVPGQRDLVEACDAWFAKLRRNSKATVRIQDSQYGIQEIELRGKSAQGYWSTIDSAK